MAKIVIILLAVFFGFGNYSYGQDSLFSKVENSTYSLYLEGAYSELIEKGENALKSGFDYFFLRLRLGIAYFYLGEYTSAIDHLIKAERFNSGDDLVTEYLYLSFKYLGRNPEAHRITGGFSSTLKRAYSLSDYDSKAKINTFGIDIVGNYLQNENSIENYFSGDAPISDGALTVTRRFRYFGATLQHQAGKNISLLHSSGLLMKRYYYFTVDDNNVDLIENAQHKQFQYYLSAKIILGNRASIISSIHYLSNIIPLAVNSTGILAQAQKLYLHDFASTVGLELNYGKLRNTISVGYSNINNSENLNANIVVAWFPKGNLDLYSVTSITGYRSFKQSGTGLNIVADQEVGFRILPGFWIEAGYKFGEMENFAGPGAYMIYNDAGTVSGEYGLGIIAPVKGKRHTYSLRYTRTVYNPKFLPDSPDIEFPIYNNTIFYHKFSGGIKWTF